MPDECKYGGFLSCMCLMISGDRISAKQAGLCFAVHINFTFYTMMAIDKS